MSVTSHTVFNFFLPVYGAENTTCGFQTQNDDGQKILCGSVDWTLIELDIYGLLEYWNSIHRTVVGRS